MTFVSEADAGLAVSAPAVIGVTANPAARSGVGRTMPARNQDARAADILRPPEAPDDRVGPNDGPCLAKETQRGS